MTANVQWILWTGSMGFGTPIADRVRAAVAGGYSRISISPTDVHQVREVEGHARSIGALARDHGLEIVMDPVVNWHPHTDPGPFRSAAFTLEDMLDMCEETGSVAMTAVAMVDSLVPDAGLTESFADLCQRASVVGVDVQLEFIPMTAIQDLRAAWDIVCDAGSANGGLLFDTWHFFRGRPDLELLSKIPGDRIFAVQISDAAETPVQSLWYDTLHRSIPGEGAFDLAGVVDALAETGGLNWVGAEVIHPDLAAMDAAEAAELAAGPVRELVVNALHKSGRTADETFLKSHL
jgi:sugar phosphate isomerase/epimerase